MLPPWGPRAGRPEGPWVGWAPGVWSGEAATRGVGLIQCKRAGCIVQAVHPELPSSEHVYW